MGGGGALSVVCSCWFPGTFFCLGEGGGLSLS